MFVTNDNTNNSEKKIVESFQNFSDLLLLHSNKDSDTNISTDNNKIEKSEKKIEKSEKKIEKSEKKIEKSEKKIEKIENNIDKNENETSENKIDTNKNNIDTNKNKIETSKEQEFHFFNKKTIDQNIKKQYDSFDDNNNDDFLCENTFYSNNVMNKKREKKKNFNYFLHQKNNTPFNHIDSSINKKSIESEQTKIDNNFNICVNNKNNKSDTYSPTYSNSTHSNNPNETDKINQIVEDHIKEEKNNTVNNFLESENNMYEKKKINNSQISHNSHNCHNNSHNLTNSNMLYYKDKIKKYNKFHSSNKNKLKLKMNSMDSASGIGSGSSIGNISTHLNSDYGNNERNIRHISTDTRYINNSGNKSITPDMCIDNSGSSSYMDNDESNIKNYCNIKTNSNTKSVINSLHNLENTNYNNNIMNCSYKNDNFFNKSNLNSYSERNSSNKRLGLGCSLKKNSNIAYDRSISTNSNINNKSINNKNINNKSVNNKNINNGIIDDEHIMFSELANKSIDINDKCINNNTKIKIKRLCEKIEGFEKEIKNEIIQKKNIEKEKIYIIREAITKLEKNLNNEIKKRIEHNRNIQNIFSSELLKVQEKIENVVNDKVLQIEGAIKILNDKVNNISVNFENEKVKCIQNLEKKKNNIAKDFSNLQLQFNQDKINNKEKEGNMCKRLEDIEKKMESKISIEKNIRDSKYQEIMAYIEEIKKEKKGKSASFQNFVLEELSAVKNGLMLESQTREAADDDIVQAVNHYTKALQDSLKLINSN
ncbi:filament assembling protein, putative [Hepatocystis sp. ex Piliocolobus tephrosceles]|nr:filament assembling protein, putative [Hepatocystis sp. ex Piliocolobus tephrosceles]